MNDRGFNTYLFNYHHDGANWSFEVQAKDEEDAKSRVAKMAWAQLDGKLYGKIPVRSSWPARATVWLLNKFSAGGSE